MKKSQRARLAELTAKAEASRSVEEKAEFVTLTALAVANPDATKDTDEAPAVAAAPAATAAAPVTPTLKGFIASLKGNAAVGTELVAARATINTLTGERDSARNDLTTVRASLASAEAQLGVFGAFFGITLADLAKNGPDTKALGTLITQKISDQALEQVAAIGFPAADLPKPPKGDGNGAGETFAEKLEALAAMPAGPAKDEFYAKQIVPAFAAKN